MDVQFVNLNTAADLPPLSGLAFERYLEQLFVDLGYAVERTPASGDFGADLMLSGSGESVASASYGIRPALWMRAGRVASVMSVHAEIKAQVRLPNLTNVTP